MATTSILPEPGKFYHIFNRGINGCDLFREQENYYHFLRLYEKYLHPEADTYAWCLLRNHFHVLVQVRGVQKKSPEDTDKRNPVSQALSNLFNAYTKAVNKRYDRTGSLFEKNFHRIEVSTETYLRNLVVYIHNNPVHHDFCDYLWDYPWSSYGTIVSLHPTKLQRDGVIGWFDNKANFTEVHKRNPDTKLIEKFIFE